MGALTNAEPHATAGGSSGGNVVCPKCEMEFAPAFALLLDVHMAAVHPKATKLPTTWQIARLVATSTSFFPRQEDSLAGKLE